MTQLGELLRGARKRKGWSLEKVGEAIGLSRSAINQWELGITRPDGERIPVVLGVLNINADAYMRAMHHDSGNAASSASRSIDAGLSPSARSRGGPTPSDGKLRKGRLRGDATRFEPAADEPDDVPVYGARDIGGGVMALTAKRIEEVERAPFVAEAFDVYVACDAMSPAYERGDRVRIFPHSPIKAGGDVLLLSAEMGTAPDAAIRRLVEITLTHWVVKQWNPPKQVKLDRREWPIAYRIVGVTRQ